ncbi:hypothetical protein EPA93_30120 [Ktedonosporobacter rubrisoli]|uniref:Uncharacterized protein n=1 Tax=Ktedonosporobacter rubrisoli TaxID=2509675 RepID=A0A4P6JXB8_KTERU|nr:hypothetical protein [Ktedonosporobacter rubrisoli]QBD80010.1 hypothetical protein EPA93_30120 [Ktedonosporobacter rubrisoli]
MNLWADIDSNHLLPGRAEHGSARRMRRYSERYILSSLRKWLLHDYVAAYCRSLGATRIFRRCYWLDALGIDPKAARVSSALAEPALPADEKGRKARKKSATPVAQPPALQPIVKLANGLAQESKPIALHGLVLATGSSKRAQKKSSNSTAEPQLADIPKESSILATNWLEIAPELLKEIAQAPAIFLLNPFGQTTFRYDDLAALYQRTVPTELCLFISHKQVGDLLTTALHSVQSSSPSPTVAVLTALLRTDRWKSLAADEGEIPQAVAKLIDLFIASMQRHFLLPVQRISIPLALGPSVIEHAPYSLIFATRRQDSFMCMNDAVCLQNRCVYQQSYQGVLSEAWFAAQERKRYEQERQELYQAALQLGRTQRIRRWPDLRQQLLLTRFGQFTMQDYDIVIQELLVSREVYCERRRQVREGEEMPIPGNDDMLVWA